MRMMRMAGRRGRRTIGRGQGGRAVSPVLATVLLVAIVVVLAAVLYLLVFGLVGTSRLPSPIGDQLAVGPAKFLTGTSSTNSYCQTSHYCYSVPVAQVQSSLPIDGLAFKVLTTQNAPWEVSKNYARLAIVGLNGNVLAYTQISKNNPYVVSSWAHYSSGISGSTTFTNQMTLMVQFGNPAHSPAGQGLTLVVYGTSAYSGQVSASLP